VQLPFAPQYVSFVSGSTQEPPQSTSPPTQVQDPPAQAWPPAQARPHDPQLPGSNVKFVQ